MGKIEVMVSESANDLPPSLWHEDWTVEQLDEAIAEAEKNPPQIMGRGRTGSWSLGRT